MERSAEIDRCEFDSEKSMRPIHSRHDLLALVAQHAPTKACARAVSEDRAVLLGGFAPTGELPCYIVKVTAKFGQQWFIRVDVDEEARCYRTRTIVEADIPWIAWQGVKGGTRPLIDGDK